MKPTIDQTDFGSITIDGIVFDHDVLILPNGEVKKRMKPGSDCGPVSYYMLATAAQAPGGQLHKSSVRCRLVLGSDD